VACVSRELRDPRHDISDDLSFEFQLNFTGIRNLF
jgi:hypothetical protein